MYRIFFWCFASPLFFYQTLNMKSDYSTKQISVVVASSWHFAQGLHEYLLCHWKLLHERTTADAPISQTELSCRSLQSLSIYCTCQGRSQLWRLHMPNDNRNCLRWSRTNTSINRKSSGTFYLQSLWSI